MTLTIATGTLFAKPHQTQPATVVHRRNARPCRQQHQRCIGECLVEGQPFNPTVREVRGQLYDANGQPLVGATVTSTDGRTGRHRHHLGFYNLQVGQGTTALSYQSLGCTVETINISSPVMNVSLAPAALTLDVLTIAEVEAEEAPTESLFGRASSRRREIVEDLSLWPWTLHTTHANPIQRGRDLRHPSDGHPHAVRIQDHCLDAEYLHQCAPSWTRRCT